MSSFPVYPTHTPRTCPALSPFRITNRRVRRESGIVRSKLQCLPTAFPNALEVMPTGAWQEHATGLKLGGNVPVRTNHASKRRG